MSEALNMDLIHTLAHVLSGATIAIGSFFIVVGAIGLIRMPDVFTRMHAVSLIETVGAGFLLVGFMIQSGPTLLSLKLLFVFILFFFTAPVATHAVAQAALSAGEKPQLSEDLRSEADSLSKPAAAIGAENKAGSN